ncbi:hypothetical protein F5Y16DRAFT_254826 [Xylariaceae sp. FL0255]|nr:hypothetical protein F5Y16DRAFT_254826 [Xylariaceae sp. FL0255]
MQLYHASNILLHLHNPVTGNYLEYARTRKSLKNNIAAICGIAMTLDVYMWQQYAISVSISVCCNADVLSFGYVFNVTDFRSWPTDGGPGAVPCSFRTPRELSTASWMAY